MTIPQYLWYAPVHPLARRVTDRERDQALAMLTAALQRGQVTVEEHSARMEGALHAQTVRDLVNLTRDLLPAQPHRAAPAGDGSAPRSLADATLASGIVGLVLFPLFLGSVVAIVLSLVALAEIRGGASPPTAMPRVVGGMVAAALALAAGAIFYAVV
jgi:Domain of unknown function (DUF1707)